MNKNLMESRRIYAKKYTSAAVTFLSVIAVVFLLLCCDKEVIEAYPKRNILFYIATDSDVTIDTDAPGKIQQIRAGWKPERGEMVFYVDRRSQGAVLLRINDAFNNGRYGIDTLAEYGKENSADMKVLKRVIDEFTTDFPADSYGMIFFSHASGWLPEGMLNYPRSIVRDDGGGTRQEMKYTDFASAIQDKQFDFIIFEACLMADAMTMYELRNKADYIMVSSAEIVAPGFTDIYAENIMSLYDTKRSVDMVVKGFADAYCKRGNDYNSFTMGVIKMNEMEALAAVTKTTLKGMDISEDYITMAEMQTFDRPNALIASATKRSRYFDLSHVIANLVSESDFKTFNSQMQKTVIWKASTERFLPGESGFLINHHSGLTTYIKQAVYPELNAAFENSSWYKAIY